MTVPQPELDKYARMLRTWGAVVTYWQRGTAYHDENLKAADAVVVILPERKWWMDFTDIPRGTRSEIEKSLQLNIPLYLAYTIMDNAPHIFDAHTTLGRIKGEAGTRDNLQLVIKESTRHLSIFGEDGPAKKIENARMEVKYVVVDVDAMIRQTYGGRDKRLLFRLRK